MDKLLEDKSVEESIKEIVQHEDFNYLALQLPSPSSSSHDFNGSKKSAAYIRDALNSASKCKICNGLLHRNSITIDHIQRKKDGGTATINNAQLAHPYCNTGIKN